MKSANNVPQTSEQHAYLVRLWRDSAREPWRASAKQVSTGREFHFVSPEKLFLFLHEQTNGAVMDASAHHA